MTCERHGVIFELSEICRGYLTYLGAAARKRRLSRTYFVGHRRRGETPLKAKQKKDRVKNNGHDKANKELLLL